MGKNTSFRRLDSILGQTYSEFELIISDNASNDRTPEICQEFARKDPRIRYFRQPTNIGRRGTSTLFLSKPEGGISSGPPTMTSATATS